ncbi:uncharacterized protein SPSK_02837 [Sporothrix schenckii 1099-18]|uniref:Uncharacterized protein n=1 Tax=Sporothrix schenckii 1099-18 TaxID=1397361 RepID=A0A0F2MAH5_SPOSC|nr:uncharacterized protein SPSK_02837 [Sporothrix schenckii 1099-18]KJR86642.1 hypothetical protein SPSK_02837 [Sporothrix schenckii 1099-18]
MGGGTYSSKTDMGRHRVLGEGGVWANVAAAIERRVQCLDGGKQHKAPPSAPAPGLDALIRTAWVALPAWPAIRGVDKAMQIVPCGKLQNPGWRCDADDRATRKAIFGGRQRCQAVKLFSSVL